jgi:hypothetical protein
MENCNNKNEEKSNWITPQLFSLSFRKTKDGQASQIDEDYIGDGGRHVS